MIAWSNPARKLVLTAALSTASVSLGVALTAPVNRALILMNATPWRSKRFSGGADVWVGATSALRATARLAGVPHIRSCPTYPSERR